MHFSGQPPSLLYTEDTQKLNQNRSGKTLLVHQNTAGVFSLSLCLSGFYCQKHILCVTEVVLLCAPSCFPANSTTYNSQETHIERHTLKHKPRELMGGIYAVILLWGEHACILCRIQASNQYAFELMSGVKHFHLELKELICEHWPIVFPITWVMISIFKERQRKCAGTSGFWSLISLSVFYMGILFKFFLVQR